MVLKACQLASPLPATASDGKQGILCRIICYILSIGVRIHINRHIYVQDPDSQRGLLQRALQGANSQNDLSVTPRGGSTPTARELSEGPPRRRNRRSSMGPDLLTGHAPRHRRSSLGPGRMEYSGGVSGELFSHGRRYRTLG